MDAHTGPHYPNSTTNYDPDSMYGECHPACLYNIGLDPFEDTDLAASNPSRVVAMLAKLEAYEQTAFNPHRGQIDPAACRAVLGEYGGFWGPFIL